MPAPPSSPIVTGLLVVALLTGCEAAENVGGPDPDDAAAALATALGSGDFQAVTFTDATADEAKRAYAKVTEGMGEVEPAVEVAGVEDAGDTATAQLAWSWPLGDHRWAYRAEASLRLVDDEWQAVWKPTLVESSLKGDEVLDSSEVSPDRGQILGAGGQALVSDRPVERLGIDRTQVKPARAGESARQLADLVGVDAGPYVKQVEAAGEEAFIEAIVFRRDEVPPNVDPQHLAAIPGAITVSDELPLAPTREFAAPILGTVGEVTAEMIEDDPEKYQLGDEAGLSGLQARYDDQLRGTPGVVVQAVDGEGSERELFAEESTPGKPLKLTLDPRMQQAAERLLSGVGPASALVAIRPSTGDILTAANGPGTDGYNMATFGQFAPGSTFKSVSSLALLREGLTPSSTVPCTDRIVVDGKAFENYDDYPSGGLGRIAFRTAVANSCNTAFISQAGKLADEALVDAASSLGMSVDHDLGFPAYFGSVEPPASETEAAADMIGQGKILASPMVMATVIASIQSGSTVLPRMVKDWEVEQADVPELAGAEATQLHTMLRGVVTSGSGSLLADVPGAPVIAKTGTAEFERGGRLLTHAWMIAGQGDLAVAVFVEEGSSGSGTAGPILESFLRTAR
ncbi:MAG TPA: penicillin-binding transpeptidase domain-containing protein [Intrasporangium sp.]|nr:penicillin-binding transpeptidase domain-containing protein [Intrasporangium sp.]